MEELYSLVDWLGHGELADGKLVLPWTREGKERFAKGKRALELIGCEHEVTTENVVLKSKDRDALLFNLGLAKGGLVQEKYDSYCEEEAEVFDDEGIVFVEERHQTKLTKYFKSKRIAKS